MESPVEESAQLPQPVPADDGGTPLTRRTRRTVVEKSAALPWQPWLAYFAVSGLIAGVLWWLLAPGGALYGDTKDFESWFPRDATLAALLLVAGVLSALLAVRGQFLPRRQRHDLQLQPSPVVFFALVLGGLAASVIAWRTGVFAGDLFRTPPENMANPSMVFSLRSASVLILWPLSSALTILVRQVIAYFLPSRPTHETMRGAGLDHG